ncbi:hypothetical protein Vadar_000259 [Vaccinium darrowii]|uniref:Uncharacterized protein n=1 Tax=Vaccinium darrowii TaxID=229202 RepID=A0ACB7YS97_9ERIC|nr:hypothetical protein Vadar_000259 [Vaccinium darrowii]
MGTDHKKVFSFAEVSSHNNPKDCWVIVNAKVYNVTNFLTDHPGGEEVLLAHVGKDASEEFEDAGHGSVARLMLDEFYVGEIDQSSTMPTKKAHIATPKQPRDNEEKSPDNITNLLRLLVPVGVCVVAVVGIHLYT